MDDNEHAIQTHDEQQGENHGHSEYQQEDAPNHDGDHQQGGAEGDAAQSSAVDGGDASGGNGVFWYGFSVGNVHVAMVSSEHDPSPDAPMGAWLVKDLAAVDRAQTPWVIVGIHRPLVETEAYPGDFAVAAGLRRILEPLLLRERVDVVVAGHYHSFQRSCACVNLTCVASGASLRDSDGTSISSSVRAASRAARASVTRGTLDD